MPESERRPGCYWAFPDSPDRTDLLDRVAAGELLRCAGHVVLQDGSSREVDVFVPPGYHPGPNGYLMAPEMGGVRFRPGNHYEH